VKITLVLVLIFLSVVPAHAQQGSPSKAQSRTAPSRKGPQRASAPTACKDLQAISADVDSWAKWDGSAAPDYNDDDPTWDVLIECANQIHSASQRAEALRVAAMWEQVRAEKFRKQYLAATAAPVRPASCDNLDQLRATVKAVTDGEPSSAITHSMQDYDSTVQALRKCMNDSVHVSRSKPDERYWSTVTLLSLELWEARRARAFFEQAYTNTTDYAKAQAEYDAKQNGVLKENAQIGLTQDEVRRNAEEGSWRKALADPSAFVVLGPGDRLESAELSQVSEHNRNLCDQVVTVAGLTPRGLALYIPPEGQSFMAKNAKNYPRMCLVQDTTSFVPGVPRYLLVWAYSEGAFAGFQPVQQLTTTPVSGSGTLTNLYGDRWNFTYSGTMTEIDTIEAPYVIQSHSLYLNAYDENGNAVSRHSITVSNQAGGDASYAAGYNAGALISMLWNNPSHLIKSVLKGVQKDSMKYGKK